MHSDEIESAPDPHCRYGRGSNSDAGEAKTVGFLERFRAAAQLRFEVGLCPVVGRGEKERLRSSYGSGAFALLETEPVVIVEPHQLAAVAVRDVGIAGEDQEVLIVPFRSGG